MAVDPALPARLGLRVEPARFSRLLDAVRAEATRLKRVLTDAELRRLVDEL